MRLVSMTRTCLWVAFSHAAAADAYVAQDPWYVPSPVLSLLARSIDLALKAYAVHHGASDDTVRYQLGGDLEATLRYALRPRAGCTGWHARGGSGADTRPQRVSGSRSEAAVRR